MKVKLIQTDSNFLEFNATKIDINNEEWYYMPYWFKKLSNDGSDGIYEEVSFEDLPEYFKKEEKQFRK